MPTNIKQRYDQAGDAGKVGSGSLATRPLSGEYLVPVHNTDSDVGQVALLSDLLSDSSAFMRMMALGGGYEMIDGSLVYDLDDRLVSADIIWADGKSGTLNITYLDANDSKQEDFSRVIAGGDTLYDTVVTVYDGDGKLVSRQSTSGHIFSLSSLIPFCIEAGGTPSYMDANSAIQRIYVRGVGLTDPISVSVTGEFSLCRTVGGTYDTSLELESDYDGYVYIQLTDTNKGEGIGSVSLESGSAPIVAIELTSALGDGSETYPYPLAVPAQLDKVRDAMAATDFYKMYCDIDMSGYGLIAPIGDLVSNCNAQIEGNNMSLMHLTLGVGADDFGGLFGVCGSDCVISNLTLYRPVLEDSAVSAGGYTGLFAGNNIGAITNCKVISGVLTLDEVTGVVGGFIGYAGGTIQDCHVDAAISTNGYIVGGFASYIDVATIRNCSARGTITLTGDAGWVAGFAAQDTGYSSVRQAYAMVDIEILEECTECFAGGFIGAPSGTEMTNCYAAGKIDYSAGSLGTGHAGGFTGFEDVVYGSTYASCHWDTDLLGLTDYSGALADVTGLTSEEMQDPEEVGVTTYIGWDFTAYPDGDWEMVSPPSYPTLQNER